MATYKMVQNDTAPDITKQITIDGNKDLTGCVVKFKIKDPDLGRTNDAHNSATFIGSPSVGLVRYSFQLGDIPNATEYVCDWEVTLANGKVWTAPGVDKLSVRAEA